MTGSAPIGIAIVAGFADAPEAGVGRFTLCAYRCDTDPSSKQTTATLLPSGDYSPPDLEGVSSVLTITENAEHALDAVVAAENAPEGAGVRISEGVGADGQPAVGLSLAPAPEPGDAVVEDANVPVFVAAEVADLLDDKILDAQVDGDQIAFRLGEQPS